MTIVKLMVMFLSKNSCLYKILVFTKFISLQNPYMFQFFSVDSKWGEVKCKMKEAMQLCPVENRAPGPSVTQDKEEKVYFPLYILHS